MTIASMAIGVVGLNANAVLDHQDSNSTSIFKWGRSGSYVESRIN